jgi:CDP-glucose 4,6-dehydratase
MKPQALSIYQDKTVLVTGDSGFKGGWLALMLERLGAAVVGYSQGPPTDPSFFEATGLSDRIQHIDGDIRDRKGVLEAVSAHRPDLIFHLAAQPIVTTSYADPAETMETNIMGTVNVLDAVRANRDVGVCVCITSDKCYENREWEFAYRENDAMGGADPYSASKGAAEIVIASYRRSFFSGLKGRGRREPVVASVRAGNVIGGGDWGKDRLVPDCIRAITAGRQIQIRNPLSIRPWQFVLEPLYGYLLLGGRAYEEGHAYAGGWNFGPQSGSSANVARMVDMIVREWGSGSWRAVADDGAVAESRTLRLDSSKARDQLGWECRYDIEESIAKTISWYKAHYSGDENMLRFSRRQISGYLDEVESGSPT